MNDWFEAEQRIERAGELVESQCFAEALTEIDAALAVNSSNASWWAKRGFVLDQMERYREAVAAYQQALDLYADDVEVSTALGADLIRVGRCAHAIEIFEQIASRLPDYEPAYCHRIIAYTELGDHDRAEEMFYLAQQLDDACPHCFGNIGVSLAMRERYDQAISCWQKVLELEPDYPGVRQRIAQALRAQGRLDQAREYYLAELREDPGNTPLLCELAELYVEGGDTAGAIIRYRHIIELVPDDMEARHALGQLLLESGQPEEALVEFQAEEQSDDPQPGLSLKLGETFAALGRCAEALPHLRLSLEEESDRQPAMMALGNCLLQLERPAEALEQFQQVAALAPESSSACHNMGVCYYLLGRHEEGLEQFLKAVELQPDLALAVQKAALCCIRLGRWTELRQVLQRGLQSCPDDETVRELYGRLTWIRLRTWGDALLAPLRRVFRHR